MGRSQDRSAVFTGAPFSKKNKEKMWFVRPRLNGRSVLQRKVSAGAIIYLTHIADKLSIDSRSHTL